jgi:hypothetical protein
MVAGVCQLPSNAKFGGVGPCNGEGTCDEGRVLHRLPLRLREAGGRHWQPKSQGLACAPWTFHTSCVQVPWTCGASSMLPKGGND